MIDDEQGILDVVSRFARRAGYEVVTCSGGREAIGLLQTRRADLVLVDLRMPDVGGLDVLRAIRDTDPRCQAILMTGYASVDTAVDAIKLGAMDYLSKPIDFARLEHLLISVKEEIERRTSLLTIESDLARRLEFCGMVGRGPAMQELFGMIRRLAPHVRTALITGETGTGKELAARALHTTGPRRERPLRRWSIARRPTRRCSSASCSGTSAGHSLARPNTSQGSSSSPKAARCSSTRSASCRCVVQAKLLRVLELGEVHRVGALEGKRVNVHVMAATNRDLRAEVAAGRFRSDLYYRLNVVEIRLPPLRDRREDVPYLTAAFVRGTAERLQKRLAGLTPGAERLLGAALWEGNVRELRNVIERACILADGEFITERELAVSMPVLQMPRTLTAASSRTGESDLLVNVEREHIQRALERANGNKKAAARMLGLSRRALYRRLERLDLGDTIMRRREAPQETVNA